MPITNEEAYWLYRCILGRPPESEEALRFQSTMLPDFNTAREVFIGSREFQDKMMPPVNYHPQSHYEPLLEKPRGLAVAAIVKNESESIETMLKSCLPIASYVVIADTGSIDETKIIAETILKSSDVPYTLADISFVDFSQARNEALALVPTSMHWVLMIDADEHLVPADYSCFAALLEADVDAWGLPRYNFTDADKVKPVQTYPDHQNRLIRHRANNPVRYSSPVHEDIHPPFRTLKAPADTSRFFGSRGGPHIHHLGCVDVKQEEARERSWFYAELASRK